MTSTTTSTPVRVHGDYLVARTDDITFDTTGASPPLVLDSGGAPPAVSILGAVHVDFSGPAPYGAFAVQQATADPAASFRIGAGGSLVVDAGQTPDVVGYFSFGQPAAPFENDGVFSVTGGNLTSGFSAFPGGSSAFPNGGVGGSLINNGQFYVSSSGQAGGIGGLDLASVTNAGTITVSGSDLAASSYGLDLAHTGASLAATTVTNTGSLSVTGHPGSMAIEIIATTPYAVTLSNSGTISGDYAIWASSTAALDLTNTGTIDGTIHLAPISGLGGSYPEQASSIHNGGAIHGDIDFAGGDGWLYDGRGGTLTGGLHLGSGSATALLGDDGETVYGRQTFQGQPTEGPASVTGGAGNDTYVASQGTSSFDGGGGTNTVSYVQTYSGVTVDLGRQGAAQDTGGAGTETLAHVQNLVGSYGVDTLTGDAGDNVIDPGPGIDNDVLDGGPGGRDTVSFASYGAGIITASSAPGVTVSLWRHGDSQPVVGAYGDLVLNHFQDVIGSAFNDTIGGDGGDNRLDGAGGTNTVSYTLAVGGVTVSLAQQGADQDTVGDGVDLLSHFQNLTGSHYSDHLTGDAGDNVIDGGGRGTDVLDGAGGTNTLSFASTVADSTSAGVTFSLARQGQAQDTGAAGVETAYDFQNLIGSAYDDHLTGDAGNNVIDGGGPSGIAGPFSGGGRDVLDGGGGINTLSYASAGLPVTVSLALQGQAQTVNVLKVDTVTNFQNLIGSAYAGDVLEGDSGDNVLDGGSSSPPVNGQDTVSYAHAAAGVTVSLALQGQAQDTVGAGVDTLLHFQALAGSAFADTLEGGGFASTALTGGLGADTFVYRPGDGQVTVADFSAAQGDVVDLSNVIGFNAFSRVLAYASQVGADTMIALGDGGLKLQGVSLASLTAADFILRPGPSVGPGIGGTPVTGPASGGTLAGGTGDDWLQGQGGSDTLHGGMGSDYLDGGAGLNTAAYDGVLRQHVVSPDLATVTGGPEGGSDILTNIQRIQFVDGYLAASPTDYAGQVYRVYEATLGRAPDPEGLATWVHALGSGTSLQTVVDGFVGSQEFQTLYGAPDNNGFVNLLYNNVLHRPPDAQGLAGWVSALNSGQDTRAQVVLDFSESQEDIGDSAAAVQKGLWIGDTAAGEAARIYDTVFGRLPDASGLITWTHSLESGTSLQTAAADFVASAEFQSKYGSLNDNDFVTLLYQNVLHRAPDTAGLNSWLSTLSSGTARAQVVLDFSESQEHVADTAPHIDNGIWLAG
jgi:Ca2+-binding RTX toxin-like protein